MTVQTHGRTNIMAATVVADDIDQRLAEWCALLNIPFTDLSTKGNPE